MKTVPLQLITVELGNGKQGVFVGGPLLSEDNVKKNGHIEDIWFSNVQDIPNELTVDELIELVSNMMDRTQTTVQ